MPKGPRKLRRYLLKKTFGRIPTYLAGRMKEQAGQKRNDKLTPEEKDSNCDHSGTRKYVPTHIQPLQQFHRLGLNINKSCNEGYFNCAKRNEKSMGE